MVENLGKVHYSQNYCPDFKGRKCFSKQPKVQSLTIKHGHVRLARPVLLTEKGLPTVTTSYLRVCNINHTVRCCGGFSQLYCFTCNTTVLSSKVKVTCNCQSLLYRGVCCLHMLQQQYLFTDMCKCNHDKNE